MTKTPSCDEHEHADGCLCHAPVAEYEATPDDALPAALGGVQGDPKPRARRRKATRTSVEGEA